MEDLDFVTPARTKIYDPAVAQKFFASAGTQESVALGKTFFVENERTSGMFSKGAKMYLLLDGEVSLIAKKKELARLGKDTIFGEMALLGQLPRSATAVARADCRAISLDEKQFRRAIAKTPDFALMLMHIIVERLRLSIALLIGPRAPSDDESLKKRSVLEKELIADLEAEFEGRPPLLATARKVIMTEGEAGAFMYVVLKGRVVVTVKNRFVETVGPGGVIGDVALVDQGARVGTATAETDCSLLPISRKDFLLFVRTKPDFSLFLMKGLAERLRYMNSQFK
jgi:CRP/FNR family transcriptional regulator, cyclic AMP receptor protein